MSKPRLPKRDYFAQRLAEIYANEGWEDNPRLADKAAYFQRRIDELPPVPPPACDFQPMLHDMTIKELLRSIDEDAEHLAEYAQPEGAYLSASKVRTLIGNIQQAIMHINEHIGQ